LLLSPNALTPKAVLPSGGKAAEKEATFDSTYLEQLSALLKREMMVRLLVDMGFLLGCRASDRGRGTKGERERDRGMGFLLST
jgi:hypothetical protein